MCGRESDFFFCIFCFPVRICSPFIFVRASLVDAACIDPRESPPSLSPYYYPRLFFFYRNETCINIYFYNISKSGFFKNGPFKKTMSTSSTSTIFSLFFGRGKITTKKTNPVISDIAKTDKTMADVYGNLVGRFQ